MSIEKIAEFLATIGFEQDPDKSLDKILKQATKQLQGLKNIVIGVDGGFQKELVKGVVKSQEGISKALSDGVGEGVKRGTSSASNAIKRVRRDIRQALELDRELAPTQIFGRKQDLEEFQKAIRGTSKEFQFADEIRQASEILDSQLASKKSRQLQIDSDKSLREIKKELSTKGSDVASKISSKISKTLVDPQTASRSAIDMVRQRETSGEINSSKAKALIADIEERARPTASALKSLMSSVSQASAQVSDDLIKVSGRMRLVKTESIRLSKELAQAEASGNAQRVASATKAINKIKKEESSLRQLQSHLSYQQSAIQRQEALVRSRFTENSLSKAESRYRTFFQRLRAQVSNTRNLVNSLIIPISSALALGQIANIGRQFEGVNVALKTSLGTARAASEEFQFLRRESSRLGLSLLQTAKPFSKLTASLSELGFTSDQSREIFLGVAEASATMQLSAEDTEGAIRALVQMASKGTVQSEELNFRLAA